MVKGAGAVGHLREGWETTEVCFLFPLDWTAMATDQKELLGGFSCQLGQV